MSPDSLVRTDSLADQVAGPVCRHASRRSDLFIGDSEAMCRLREQLGPCAGSAYPVLIEGESGTGKELVASRIRALGPRRALPYVVLNCAALAPGLVESALFGHARGAFTGAASAQSGFFEAAGEGTLFLDEVGELPLDAQAKLLRVLESGEFQRVGDTRAHRARARILSATNRDLRAEVRKGRFRADLYHRLSVFSLRVPPVRERGADRLLLLYHFAHACAHESQSAPIRLDARAESIWMQHGFPGNVRELRNIVIRLHARFAGETIDAARLQTELQEAGLTCASDGPLALSREAAQAHLLAHRSISLDGMLETWERTFVEAALAITGHNLTQAARLLGVRRTTLYSRIQQFAAHDLPE